jgi:FtsZ-binding cell division protein ZapB
VELLKTFEEKIAYAVEKVKALKEEKNNLEKKIRELENIIKSKDHEIEKITSEKTAVKTHIEALLKELDSIELK